MNFENVISVTGARHKTVDPTILFLLNIRNRQIHRDVRQIGLDCMLPIEFSSEG